MLNAFRCDGGGVIGQVKFLNGEDLGTLFISIARERSTTGPLPNRIRRGYLRIPCKCAARIDVSCHDKGGAGVGPGGATEIDRISVYEDIELEVLRALTIRRADRKRRNREADDYPESRKTPHALLHDCSCFCFVIIHDLIFFRCFSLLWLLIMRSHFWRFTDVLQKIREKVTRKVWEKLKYCRLRQGLGGPGKRYVGSADGAGRANVTDQGAVTVATQPAGFGC